MVREIPNSVIGTVSSVLGKFYFNHTKLNSLFMASGAPGDPPSGNCETKCVDWLKRCNSDPAVDAQSVLGLIIQPLMDSDPETYRPEIEEGQRRIRDSLARNHLAYRLNGHIVAAGSSPAADTLTDLLKRGDFASIETEFKRAFSHVDTDPHSAVTAACAIIEALCKTYLETHELDLPAKQTVVPLWKAVQIHLGLHPDATVGEDQRKILQGLASIVDGIGAYRTHTGSAHGRGLLPATIDAFEARLAVNASHALVIFAMERWHSMK
ncbi:abortive infection family protein [Rhizobium leguminosarum]|uniref:abortive infection family protein n=1 Tax=Rhizobium leguminosarum TaxID=384 RepID=UPI001C9599BC|nr:abortive infection family protein [Rhizobium leguminosarum]MBY5585627.1 abortive infection family protein [Rhizobium leguminosarum]